MPDVIALIVIGAIVAAIIIKLVRDRRAGKRTCGGSCEGCPGCAARETGREEKGVCPGGRNGRTLENADASGRGSDTKAGL